MTSPLLSAAGGRSVVNCNRGGRRGRSRDTSASMIAHILVAAGEIFSITKSNCRW